MANALGCSLVQGFNLVPNPAANNMAFILDELIVYKQHPIYDFFTNRLFASSFR